MTCDIVCECGVHGDEYYLQHPQNGKLIYLGPNPRRATDRIWELVQICVYHSDVHGGARIGIPGDVAERVFHDFGCIPVPSKSDPENV